MEGLTRRSTYDTATTIGTKITFITNPDQSFWSHVRITYRTRKQKKRRVIDKQLVACSSIFHYVPFPITLFAQTANSYNSPRFNKTCNIYKKYKDIPMPGWRRHIIRSTSGVKKWYLRRISVDSLPGWCLDMMEDRKPRRI